jgi:hypothetical protein
MVFTDLILMSCEKKGVAFNKNDKLNDYYILLGLEYEKNNCVHEKIIDFPKYAPTPAIFEFIARYELVKLIKDIAGDIFEMGVCGGRGLFSFYHALSLLEPAYQFREIIGFDTFNGITGITEQDTNRYREIKEGDFCFKRKEEIITLAKIHEDFKDNYFNKNRIHLVEGNILETLPNYLNENKHKLVSLLYLDLDIYAPTKFSLEKVLPRMCKGSIIAFDELYYRSFPGETIALLEVLNINNHKINNILGGRINYIIL